MVDTLTTTVWIRSGLWVVRRPQWTVSGAGRLYSPDSRERSRYKDYHLLLLSLRSWFKMIRMFINNRSTIFLRTLDQWVGQDTVSLSTERTFQTSLHVPCKNNPGVPYPFCLSYPYRGPYFYGLNGKIGVYTFRWPPTHYKDWLLEKILLSG